MTRPTLIAETPNAPGRGHRFLVEPAAGVSDTVAAAVVGWCRRSPAGVGDSWVGATAAVVQTATGRPAKAVLVLAGIDTSRLTVAERAAIRTALAARLAGLDAVVAGIDWSKSGGLAVESAALAGWCDPAWRSLPRPPVAPPTTGQATVPKSSRRNAMIAVALLAAMAAVVVRAVDSRTGSAEPTGEPQVRPKPMAAVTAQPRSEVEKFRADVEAAEGDDVAAHTPRELWRRYATLSSEEKGQVADLLERTTQYAVRRLEATVKRAFDDARWTAVPAVLTAFDDDCREILDDARRAAVQAKSGELRTAALDGFYAEAHGWLRRSRVADRTPRAAAAGAALVSRVEEALARARDIERAELAAVASAFKPFPKDRARRFDLLLAHLAHPDRTPFARLETP